MISRILKSYMPKSLFGRAFLIMMVPIIGLQLVVATVFIQRNYARVTVQMTQAVALELNMVIRKVERAEDQSAAQAYLDDVAPQLRFALGLIPGATVEAGFKRRFYDVSGRSIVRTLQANIDRPVAIDLLRERRNLHLQIETGAGVLQAVVPRLRMNSSNPHQLLVLMVFTSILLVIISVLFLRNQVRPIRQLAQASEAFGKGRSVAFKPSGAEEVRRAAAAFLSMRARLERQIEQRTQMLSGVSHDLRTPLTRMKLSLGLMEQTTETRDIVRDVDDMERMLNEFLAFARGDTLEDIEPTDPAKLAARIVAATARGGADINLATLIDTPQDILIPMRPHAVERAVQNLVSNAVRHAEKVAVTVRVLPRRVEFVVEDNGPGIAPEYREQAVRPFFRLDAARNQDQGSGVGLGLSIALDVARSHGGGLVLSDSKIFGGLKATLSVPR